MGTPGEWAYNDRAHAFRRFRDTYLKNYTPTLPGIINFWLGCAGKGMSELYDKIRHDVAFRKEAATRNGSELEIPLTLKLKEGAGHDAPSVAAALGRFEREWSSCSPPSRVLPSAA